MGDIRYISCYCSFCGRSKDDAIILISAPQVFICEECIGKCVGIALTEKKLKAIQKIKDSIRAEIKASKQEKERSDG